MNDSGSEAEDLFEHLVSEFREVYGRTRGREGWNVWIDFYNFIALDLYYILRIKSEDRLIWSLTHQRLLELAKTISLIAFNVYSGAYRSAMRELRFVLESMVQAYYLDRKYPDIMAEDAWEKVDINRLYGKRLIIEKAGLDERIYKLYRELCKYAHSSKEEVEEISGYLWEEGIVPTYFRFDERLFNTCVDLTSDTMDAIAYILLQAYPEIETDLKELVAEKLYVKKALEKSKLKLYLRYTL